MKYILKKVNLAETTLKKMLTAHSNAGYIIISAFRGEYEYDENVGRNNRLINDINACDYSYIPVWGGFIESDKETGKTREVKERSFVVFNFKRGTSEPKSDSEGLKKLGASLAKKYNQESYLYKPMGTDKKAFYLTPHGKVDMTFNSVSPTKSSDLYFTNLAKSAKENVGTKAFTYREGVIWMADSPQSLHEAIKRRGELFFKL